MSFLKETSSTFSNCIYKKLQNRILFICTVALIPLFLLLEAASSSSSSSFHRGLLSVSERAPVVAETAGVSVVQQLLCSDFCSQKANMEVCQQISVAASASPCPVYSWTGQKKWHHLFILLKKGIFCFKKTNLVSLCRSCLIELVALIVFKYKSYQS